MKFLTTILVNSLALFLVSYLLPGVVFTGGWAAPVIAGVVMTLLNAIVKPILSFLSFPLVFATAGLFLIVLNAVILYLCVYIIQVMDVEGVAMLIDGPLTYLIAAIIFGCANWLIHWFLKDS